jgi:hypothetical protein
MPEGVSGGSRRPGPSALPELIGVSLESWAQNVENQQEVPAGFRTAEDVTRVNAVSARTFTRSAIVSKPTVPSSDTPAYAVFILRFLGSSGTVVEMASVPSSSVNLAALMERS